MVSLLAFCLVTAASAQNADSDLAVRVKALEEKVAQIQKIAASAELDEVRREIDVLSHEVEALKNGQTKAVATADTADHGLGAAASKVYRTDSGISHGGYGEFLYQNPGGPDVATANLERAVLYTGYKFNDRALFNSELEVEGGSTERHGAVSVEFAYLDYLLRPEVNIRAGVVLMPVGLLNEQHEPTSYFGARRPRTEHDIIPATWGDLGAGFFGEAGRITYRAYVVTGLDSAGFDSNAAIREGRQAGASALAENLAVVGRADWHPFEGTLLGASLYRGSSGQGRGYAARVGLGEVHADSKFRGAALRALWSRGSVSDAAAINEANGLRGADSIGSTFGGWYVEGGYDLGALLARGIAITPYARYEKLDTQRSVPAGFHRNPENQRTIRTLGLAFRPLAQTVIKMDYERTSNADHDSEHQFNLALGYIF